MDEDLSSGVKIIITNDSGVTASVSLFGSCGAIFGDSEQDSLCSNVEEDSTSYRDGANAANVNMFRSTDSAPLRCPTDRTAASTAATITDHQQKQGNMHGRRTDAEHPRRMHSLLTQPMDSSSHRRQSPSQHHLVVNSPMLCPLSPVKPMRMENFFFPQHSSTASFGTTLGITNNSDGYSTSTTPTNNEHQSSLKSPRHKKYPSKKRTKRPFGSKAHKVRSCNFQPNNNSVATFRTVSTTDNSDSEEASEMLLRWDNCVNDVNCDVNNKEDVKEDIKKRIAKFRLPFTPMASCPPTPTFVVHKMTLAAAASVYGSTELLPQDSDLNNGSKPEANYWAEETPPRDASTFSFGG